VVRGIAFPGVLIRHSSKCNQTNDSGKTFSMGTKIYVGNLPWRATDAQLSELFGVHGEVTDAKIVTDRETGRSRGFGFVTMAAGDAAQAAIRALNGYSLEGRALVVNEAREQTGGRRPGGYGGGGGGGYGGGGGGGYGGHGRGGGGGGYGRGGQGRGSGEGGHGGGYGGDGGDHRGPRRGARQFGQ